MISRKHQPASPPDPVCVLNEPGTATDPRAVVRALIDHIQKSELQVGDRLPSIRQLAEKLHVSASVIRDAMMQVQTMGLVRILPRSGAFVQAVDFSPLVSALTETLQGSLARVDHHLFHLLEARHLVELECVSQAAQRRRMEDLLPLREAMNDMDAALERIGREDAIAARNEFVDADIRFHLVIAQIAGNPVLLTYLRALLGLIRPHLFQIPCTPERKEISRRAHLELFETLVAGDVDRARTCMHEHLKIAYDGLLKKVFSTPRESAREAAATNGAAAAQDLAAACNLAVAGRGAQ